MRTRASSARPCSTSMPWSPAMTIETTSRGAFTRLTRGSSASSGKVRMPSISFLMSPRTRSLSASSSSSAETLPMPSELLLVTRLTPSTPVRRSSTTRTMPRSISSGLAPG
jgi:hypothetical protein